MNKKKLAIIPARSGSKRIPKKNTKDFLGKPIIAYSIEVALKSGLFDEVMVSTDSIEIAEIAKSYGAKVPFLRSEINSNDFATTMDVITEVLANYKNLELKFDYTCCIYPTAPLIQVKNLVEGIEKLKENELTCVFPSVAFSYPIWRGIEVLDQGEVNMLWPEYLNTRSQDLKKVYHDAGQWYWFKSDYDKDWTWPDNSSTIIISEELAQDIDNDSDWKLAELKYRLLVNYK